MKRPAFYAVFCLTILVLSSGLPASMRPRCNRPLIATIGKHYVPERECLYYVNVTEDALLRKKYLEILSEDQDNPDLNRINEILNGLLSLLSPKSVEDIVTSLTCTGCLAGVETFHFMKHVGFSTQKILDFTKNLCIDYRIMTPTICEGIIQSYGRELLTIMDKATQSSKAVCSGLLNADCGDLPPMWNVTFTSDEKPPLLKPKPLPDTVKKLKVLHITDTHWDTEYVEGSWAECDLPICCRKENVVPEQGGAVAGKYGGWQCDIPEATLDDMLKHIKKEHPDIDYVLWTGDLPPHDIWNQDEKDNLGILRKTAAKLRKAFWPTPVYPALGNHESVPPNMFPFEATKENRNPMEWLYDQLNIEWNSWLGPDHSGNISFGAFYSKLIRPGFRLVSMNMNYCYTMNWWLVLNNVDPQSELQWLIRVLQEAENNNESVHIIGHIPPGNSDCLKAWQTNYYKIINRYENTVTAQFFGHTHTDKFEVYYDMKDLKRPFGIGYTAPSVTTYTYLNPAYRIYHIEGDFEDSRRFVIDHETWYLDLEQANADRRAEWKKLYSAREGYNMTSLYPTEWDKLYQKIAESNETLQLYDKYAWSGSPKRPVCDSKCRRSHLCDIRSCAQYGPISI